MRTIKRALVAGALALPLTLGTAGIASADTMYDENGSFAGPEGAGQFSVSSQASDGEEVENGENGGGEGGVSFDESSSFAGPDGAFSEFVRSFADGEGGTAFERGMSSATEDGASSNNVEASAGE
jgi:hypothetical protein